MKNLIICLLVLLSSSFSYGQCGYGFGDVLGAVLEEAICSDGEGVEVGESPLSIELGFDWMNEGGVGDNIGGLSGDWDGNVGFYGALMYSPSFRHSIGFNYKYSPLYFESKTESGNDFGTPWWVDKRAQYNRVQFAYSYTLLRMSPASLSLFARAGFTHYSAAWVKKTWNDCDCDETLETSRFLTFTPNFTLGASFNIRLFEQTYLFGAINHQFEKDISFINRDEFMKMDLASKKAFNKRELNNKNYSRLYYSVGIRYYCFSSGYFDNTQTIKEEW